jgi:hypothetical protein
LCWAVSALTGRAEVTCLSSAVSLCCETSLAGWPRPHRAGQWPGQAVVCPPNVSRHSSLGGRKEEGRQSGGAESARRRRDPTRQSANRQRHADKAMAARRVIPPSRDAHLLMGDTCARVIVVVLPCGLHRPAVHGQAPAPCRRANLLAVSLLSADKGSLKCWREAYAYGSEAEGEQFPFAKASIA